MADDMGEKLQSKPEQVITPNKDRLGWLRRLKTRLTDKFSDRVPVPPSRIVTQAPPSEPDIEPGLLKDEARRLFHLEEEIVVIVNKLPAGKLSSNSWLYKRPENQPAVGYHYPDPRSKDYPRSPDRSRYEVDVHINTHAEDGAAIDIFPRFGLYIDEEDLPGVNASVEFTYWDEQDGDLSKALGMNVSLVLNIRSHMDDGTLQAMEDFLNVEHLNDTLGLPSTKIFVDREGYLRKLIAVPEKIQDDRPVLGTYLPPHERNKPFFDKDRPEDRTKTIIADVTPEDIELMWPLLEGMKGFLQSKPEQTSTPVSSGSTT